MNIVRLKWDSGFFKLKIGKITEGIADIPSVLKNINNFDLIYIEQFNDKKLKKNYTQLINPAYTDIKIIYQKSIKKNAVLDAHLKVYPLKTANAAMKNLAIQSGAYSRFKLDTNFKKDIYKKLYIKWIQNSVQKKSADVVLIYGDVKNPLGFITLVFKDSFAQVGLIAVDAAYQKMGIGRALIDAAEYFALKNNLIKLLVITQAENKNACNFYENAGFQKESVIYTHHHWIKNAHTL